MSSLYLSQSRLMEKNRTTYGHMNHWMNMPGRALPSNAPVTLSDGTWRRIPTMDQANNFRSVYDSTPEERFNKNYQEMTQRIAYRHPNPGMPRSRQGRIGGSWRHIKEVLGHGGSQICFVDGLVRMYDSTKFNQALSEEAPSRPHITPIVPPRTPRCTYNRYDISDHQGRVQTHRAYEYEHCLPQIPQSARYPQKGDKYQGFFKLK
ncbi:uncharacterized protein LOC135469241 [Liolophura sinensis]|uniref:uncharacterized protein LOC135469241 n=1 Tax=Liolophura sinensis TaxID=3198878 RepID=UPI0031582A6B